MLQLRPGELPHAQWAEIDLEASTWLMPSERMKRGRDGKLHGAPHLVPLPRQAVPALQDLPPLSGDGQWFFRGERGHARDGPPGR